MQRHVVSWREASVDSPARRWRRGCFCSQFLVVGQGLVSVLGDQRPALWRKVPYALGLLSALLRIYVWLDAGFPVLNRSGQRPTKALRLLCCLFHCVSCMVHLQLGINNRSRTQDFAHYFNFVNSEFLSRSALEGLALFSG